MSNEYIFKPPPPPPPPSTSTQQSSQNNNSRGRGRGRGRGGNQRGGGGNPNRGGNYNRSDGRDGPQNGGNNYNGRGRGGQQNRGGRGGYSQQAHSNSQSFQQPPSNPYNPPLPVTPVTQTVHLNPAFFPGLTPPAPDPTPAPYNLFFPPPTQFTTPHSPSNLFFASPAPVSYNDISTSTTTAPSYSHFNLPEPPSKKQKLSTGPSSKPSKPDMAQEEWLALNNGRLIGTNILPPQTESEIVAWIAERKKRFPAKATAAEREAQKQAEDQKRRAEDRVHWEKKREMRMEEVEEEEKKRVAREERRAKLRMGKEADEKRRQEKGEGVIGEESEDDGPPEEVKNSEARTVFRDDTKKNRTAQRTKKLCRDFARGNCRRGPMCPFKHEVKEKRSKQVGETGPRKSLYQRFVENDRNHENELLVQIIKYLSENGVLDDPPEEKKEDAPTTVSGNL